MEFKAVLDTAALIWNPTSLNINYLLSIDLLDFIEQFQKKKYWIVLRSRLLNEIIDAYPMSQISTQYPLNEIESKPDLKREYFNSVVNEEIMKIISEIHTHDDRYIFFSFQKIWFSQYKQLITILDNSEKKHPTFIYDSSRNLQSFFNDFELKFMHNPKHDRHYLRTNKDEIVSILSGYNGTNDEEYQQLLHTAIPYGDKCFYNIDSQQNWIKFYLEQKHQRVYHAHDVLESEVPYSVRKEYNKAI